MACGGNPLPHTCMYSCGTGGGSGAAALLYGAVLHFFCGAMLLTYGDFLCIGGMHSVAHPVRDAVRPICEEEGDQRRCAEGQTVARKQCSPPAVIVLRVEYHMPRRQQEKNYSNNKRVLPAVVRCAAAHAPRGASPRMLPDAVWLHPLVVGLCHALQRLHIFYIWTSRELAPGL